MPVKVWKEVVKIQPWFLWGGLSNRSKICWVSWNDICKPKRKVGLGIRDLRLINASLLAKWRWKLLSPDNNVWKDIVVARYGQHVIGKGNLGITTPPRLASQWWKDICHLDKDSNWFSEAMERRVAP
ncbi:ribonuclease H [Trifolium pratense]|uniref:Ribonuclease H n=1 Tax=Trifolium pratense TaxID=57577 RepID=A0A2K3M9A0_TRIPR|nr:ribonuclease H [Trifolium pratense]